MMRRVEQTMVLAVVLALSCSRGDSKDSGDKPKPGADDGPTAPKAPTTDKGQLPGAPPLSVALYARLQRALAARGPDYEPRTRHLTATGKPKYTNRLILETSPYLLQHAHNPVNWYAWGDEAFATAKRLGRPVLLSVGYSTCHWCHVMEEESFEDPEIARYLNQHYVVIKVDREERPDIDALYMNAVRNGGWPMTVWLTYDRKPFFGATYFPPRKRPGSRRPGFLQILRHFAEQYEKDPKQIHAIAARLAKEIRRIAAASFVGSLDATVLLHNAATRVTAKFDSQNGGITGTKTKFPNHVPMRFLLRYHRRTGDQQSLRMVTLTLDKMAAGGIYDHVGGGFHRYTTDRQWRVPHFEKMLYDNAAAVVTYLEAYQVTKNPTYAGVARETLRYVRRDMTSPEGAFYSATDADSIGPKGHRVEGRFFTWTPAELASVLDAEQLGLARAYFNITAAGDYEGRNVLHVTRTLAEVAAERRMPVDRARLMLETIKRRLYEARHKRKPPLRDDKVLTAWNGLMISAYARAHLVLGTNTDGGPSYLDQARRAARFVWTKLRRGDRLLRSFRAGRARLAGYLGDYAFFIAGLLDLFEADGNPAWLRHAITLERTLAKHFEAPAGGFWLVANDRQELLARQKPGRDGPVPNGNSVHALNLLRLHQLTGNDSYRARAKKLLDSYAGLLTKQPEALGRMLTAVDFYSDQAKQIVIVPPQRRAEARPFLTVLANTFVPNRVLVVAAADGELSGLVPLVAQKKSLGGKTTAYVCLDTRCKLPTSDPQRFAAQIKQAEPLPSVAPTKRK